MTRDPIEKLLFVYNADSGPGQGLLDVAHKVLKPDTYPCRLCELTHGLIREKVSWKKFRKNLNIPVEFLHKDEFLAKYASKFLPAYTFPVVFEVTRYELEVFLGTEELNALAGTDDLIREVEKRLPKG